MSGNSDYQLIKDFPTVIGRNLYLLGMSEDGPYMQPVLIHNKEEARAIFGDEAKGNLVKAFDQAYDRNSDISIYLMRITGNSATLNIEGILEEPEEFDEEDLLDSESFLPDDPKYCLHLYTIHAGTKYNEYCAWLTVDESDEEDYFTLHFLVNDEEITYNITSEMPLRELTLSINNDCRKGIHNIMAATDFPDQGAYTLIPALTDNYDQETDEETPVYFKDGDDGLTVTKNDLYLACDLAYKILESRAIDIIVPVGMYVDDVHPAYLYGNGVYGSAFYSSTEDYLQLLDSYNNNKVVSFHEQLIEFCREQMRLGYMTHGVMGLRPFRVIPENIESDTTFISRLAQSTAFKDRHGFLEYVNGSWYDKGYFVSVVAMDLNFTDYNGAVYYDNGAARYAAILLEGYDTTTNVPVGDDVELRYELSNFVLASLSKIGVVTFKDSVRKGLVVASGVTASSPDTDYHNVANVRMVQLTLAYMNDVVNEVFENDAGFDFTMRQNMLNQEVRQRLDILSQNGILNGYDFEVAYRADEVVGEILLTLQTKYSVEGIQASTEVAFRRE